MKKKFASCCFVLLFLTGLLHAQRGFTVTGAFGGGGSGLLTGGNDLQNEGHSGTAPMTVSLQLRAGYRMGRFSLVTGLQYFTSGFDQYINIPVGSEPQILTNSFTFRNVMLPVSLQLHMPMGQWFELLPEAGLGISYTGHALYEIASPVPDRKVLSRDEFKAAFRRYNVWGTLGLHLACNFNEQMAILAGVDLMATINGIDKEKPTQRAATRLLAGNVNLGFRYKFYR